MTSATSLQARLLKGEQIAEGTMAFHFAKPAGFEFRPGQTIDMTLLNPPETDAEGNTRTFSLASAPFETDLMIATRIRDSSFKRVLAKAPQGLAVKIDGPAGDFVLHRKVEKPAVLVAGGIGITPFLSMVRQAAHDRSPQQIWLFYSNRRPEDTAFLEILNQVANENPNFHLIATMTGMDKSGREWKGETGLIGKEMLLKNLPSLAGPTYYTAGPPAMVAEMRKTLVDAGADEDDIRSEEFPGY